MASQNTIDSRVRLILRSPDKVVTEYALHFKFFAFNNEAEYETLMIGLRVVKNLEVRYLRVYSDSQLIISQVQREHEAQEPNMIKYL